MDYKKEIEEIKKELENIQIFLGKKYLREKSILNKIREIEKLIDDKQYNKAEKNIDLLGSVIGENDNELVRLRTVLDFETI